MRLKLKFVKQVKVEEYCAPNRVGHTPKFHTTTKLSSLGLKILLGSTLNINSVVYQTWDMEPTLENQVCPTSGGKGFQAQQLRLASMSQSM
jgi:hypothetical protein